MMSEEYELEQSNTDEVEQDTAEAPEVEAQATEKDNSTWLDFNVIEDPVQRQKFQDRTNKDFRELKAREREIELANKRARDLEKQLLEARKPQEVQPPSVEDFEDDPQAAYARQQQYLSKQADLSKWQQEQNALAQREQQEQQQRMQKANDTFLAKARAAKIDDAEVMRFASVAVQRLPEEMQTAIAEHEYGPQLLKEIVSNELVLTEMASLSPYEAGMKIEAMSKAFRPRTQSKTPPPVEPLNGAGSTRSELKHAAGATFS